MENVKRCSLDLVDPPVTSHQSAPRVLCYMSQKILFATERILTEGQSFYVLDDPLQHGCHYVVQDSCLHTALTGGIFFKPFFNQDTP